MTMFKRICLFLGVCVLFASIGGCAAIPYAIGGLEAAGHMGAYDKSPPSPPQSDLVLGKVLESYQVGKYEVGVSDGFFKNKEYIIFMAYKKGIEIGSVGFDKQKPEDMRTLNDFNRMDVRSKKQQIRDWFLKYNKIDLGPIEPETAEKPSKPEKPKENVSSVP